MIQTSEDVLRDYIDPGERLLWAGKPRPGVFLRPEDAFLIPFSLLWGGFAIFWEIGALASGAPFFAIFGLPFVCIGLYIIFGRFFVDARVRERTTYGITNERILIIKGLFSQELTSLSLSTLAESTLVQHGNNRGSIRFGAKYPMNQFFASGSWPGARRYAPPAFEFIKEPREVYNIIREAQRAASSRNQ